MTLSELLKATLVAGASDLHLSVGTPPQVRVDGDLRRLDHAALTPDSTKTLVYSVLTDVQKKKFEEQWELDLAFGLRGVGRFRCNVFNQKGAVGAVFRLIPEKIRSLEDLGLPPALAHLADRPRGLVLVTGPTGSGKSTTLAAMVNYLNHTQQRHIITIEDPIEYLHTNRLAAISQREVGTDTESFGAALRAALREDPDVVLVGEMRDLESIAACLTIAATGHLVIATLHTNDSAQAVTRIIDAFPSHQQSQVRTQLSLVLEGIVCQALVPKAVGPGRVAALEILTVTPAVRNLIREDKVHQIYSAMQVGQEKHGMQTMNQALARLVDRRAITRDAAFATSSNRDELTTLLQRNLAPALMRG